MGAPPACLTKTENASGDDNYPPGQVDASGDDLALPYSATSRVFPRWKTHPDYNKIFRVRCRFATNPLLFPFQREEENSAGNEKAENTTCEGEERASQRHINLDSQIQSLRQISANGVP